MTSPTLPFVLYFRNSLIVSLSTALLVVLAGSGGAYALARLSFRGKNVFGISLLIVQMFPPVVLVIPLFVVIAKLRLVDTHFGLVLALVTFNLPFVTWLLRGYFLGLPQEIEDAARIDGCGRFGVLFRIALPLSAPGVPRRYAGNGQLLERLLFAFVLINDDTKRVLATGVPPTPSPTTTTRPCSPWRP